MEEQRLQEELKRTRKELLLLYEIGNLIRTTLLLDEVTYLILSAVTSHEGLGFNRAIIFLVDDAGTHLEGKMGIGPAHAEAAPTAWKMIEDNKITLEGLLDVYHKANRQIDRELNEVIRQVRFPIEKDFGVLPKTVIQDTPYLIAKEDVGHELSDMRLRNLSFGQFAVVPLRGKEHVIGALMVDNVSTKKKIEEADVRRLMMLANHGGLALENAKTFSDMVITSQQDSLTKLWNHGHFQKTLTEAIKESRMTKKEMSLVLFDVDDFKMYNDSFGHQTGDRALEFISRTAKTVMRRNDCLARYGGEEFAAIFPGTSREEALKMAERLRGIIEKETSAAWQTIAPKTITVSAGVATFPEDADEKEKLIYCADAALYEAKRSGKNQVRVYRKPN
jgi:diguanylate cyclase (GGDEF)-like protein